MFVTPGGATRWGTTVVWSLATATAREDPTTRKRVSIFYHTNYGRHSLHKPTRPLANKELSLKGGSVCICGNAHHVSLGEKPGA